MRSNRLPETRQCRVVTKAAPPRRLPAAMSAILLLSAGCFTGCAGTSQSTRPTILDEHLQASEELQQRLRELVDDMQASVEQAASEIERQTSVKEQRRTAARWRIHAVAAARATLDEADPRESLLDLWAFSWRMQNHFTTGEGRNVFGEYQELAVDTSKHAVDAVEQMAREPLGDEFEPARERVMTYANEHPLGTEYSGEPLEKFSDHEENQTLLKQIVEIPLSPFAAMSGVGKTPGSVRDVSRSIDGFTEVVEDLPADARWQMQLLVMNLEETETIVDMRKAVTQVGGQLHRAGRELGPVRGGRRRDAA